ncbi:MAG: hypothetical protein C0483_16170 [Pirellula sp.]|nr:hypothetical protein [Pirellula sp.]
MPFVSLRGSRLPLIAVVLLHSAAVFAVDEEDEDEPKVSPGLVASFSSRDLAEPAAVRVDTEVQFVWGPQRPDLRVSSGPFVARWQGLLFTQATGDYRFHVYAGGGRVELRLKGQALLAVEAKEPAWHVTEPLRLGYAHSPLVLTFHKTGEDAVLKLDWSGPQFAVEPIPDRHLFHDPKQTPSAAFEEGRSLVRMLRCSACHTIPTERDHLPAPALTHLRGNLHPEWIVEHLVSLPSPLAGEGPGVRGEPTHSNAITLTRRMPHFAVTKEDAEAIAAYLLDASRSSPEVKLPKVQVDEPKKATAPAVTLDPRAAEEAKRVKAKSKARQDASVREGELLARSVGCLACHTIGTLGTASLFSGGDLTEIARKRPAEFFLRWLDNPAALNAQHRMPVFKLAKLERDDLTAYLSTLKGTADSTTTHQPRRASEGTSAVATSKDAPSPVSASPSHPLPQGARGEKKQETKADKSLVNRGRKLFTSQSCTACHRGPVELPPVDAAPALTAAHIAKLGDKLASACLGEPHAGKPRPGYRLDEARRNAIVAYLRAAVAPEKKESLVLDGRFVLQERNCTACHARGLGQGLAGEAPRITAAEPELLAVQPALLPPSLNGVGDKLTEAALDDALLLKRDPLRPWLRVRMPKFPLAGEELSALKGHLVDHDRIPDLPPPAEAATAGDDETAQRLAARRLVTADGFGCTSCHKIGSSEPVGITNIAAHGTDLTLLGDRIRKPWFDRWVRNPSRIIPRMEMPAIQLPVKGVMHDDVNLQLASVWKVLNEPGFTPPLPNPVRIVRSRNVPGLKERANILTDVFVVDGKTYDSAIVIGLPNRHNVLFDLETNRLVAWWTGDTALQRTKGKSWYWEAGGAMVFAANPASDQKQDIPESVGTGRFSELLLGRGKDRWFAPNPTGQNIAVLDSFESRTNGAAFSYRMNDASISQEFETLPPDERGQGFRRTVEIDAENLPEDMRRQLDGDVLAIALRLIPYYEPSLVADHHKFEIVHGDGRPTIELVKHNEGRLTLNARLGGVALELKPDVKSIRLVVDYRVNLPVDTFPVDIPVAPSPPAVKIDVVPGYEAVQLPLGIAEMPTGLAWRPDGSLVLTSLKGRIIAARDTNGDGLEDQLQTVSDDLAAPYGIAVADEDGKEVLDVINKYALLRLFDDDGDGYYERNVVAASGWGHTEDYHDWAVGLPRIPSDKLGSAKLGYYVGLPCQQDDRVPAKAALRGQGLRLLARTPTKDDPRRFTVEPFCGGLRFPMGLAVNKAGDLFASDNQGNYNPFNEINHLVDGRRYGFINKLEAEPGFSPPVESPAVELPHPWTRSVNGICFLDTPEKVRAERKAAGKSEELFGPFEGHMLGCEFNYRSLFRMALEDIDGVYQGSAFPLNEFPAAGQATFEGPTVCEVAPDGDLYIGNLQDSGWGGGRNTGSLVRMRPSGELPAGMAEIRAEHDGFTIDFTQPVNREAAADRSVYTVEMFRRISTPQYGGNDVDRQGVKVLQARVADDGRSVRLTVDKMKPGFVYEFHLANLAPKSASGEAKFFPAEGFYTLKRLVRK